jgi:hypothetical protein
MEILGEKSGNNVQQILGEEKRADWVEEADEQVDDDDETDEMQRSRRNRRNAAIQTNAGRG